MDKSPGENETKQKCYKSTHTRLAESKRRRNIARKKYQKEKKRLAHKQKLEKELEKDEKIRELDSKNSLLSRTLKTINKSKAAPVVRYSLPKSLLEQTRDKSAGINQALTIPVTEFKKNELEIIPVLLGEGGFGTICLGRLSSFQQQVAVKKVVVGRSIELQAYVETKIMLTLNGHENFPLTFGFARPNFIVFEFIGKGRNPSPTLGNVLRDDKIKKVFTNWVKISIDICIAVEYMHNKGILHNDLHPGNILLRDTNFVKIIDFGKATLIDDPVMYNLEPKSKKQERYNSQHFHLAHELRNVRKSYQSAKTDIYTLGYDFQLVSKLLKNDKMYNVACHMMSKTPTERPSLPQVIYKFEKLLIK